MRLLSRVVELDVRPRRSRDTKSTRARAESRVQSRMFGLEAEGYVTVGRTVWTAAVRARHERRREACEAREAARWPTAVGQWRVCHDLAGVSDATP